MQNQLISPTPEHAPQLQRLAGEVRKQPSLGALFLAILTGFALVSAPSAQSQTFTTLYSFSGENDGWNPIAPVLYINGNLYGTTEYGNSDSLCKFGNAPSNGCGTVYEISSIGSETLLHVFTGSPDGQYPSSGLIQDSAGNFYGTTLAGGTSGNSGFDGYGTVYKIDVGGNESVLHSFTSTPDGDTPVGNLIIDAAGNLYGATYTGGANRLGSVFKVNSKGNETLLHSFAGAPTDGQIPWSGLVMDGKGNLYGTTKYGGDAPNSGGTVFKVDKKGQETVLYNFTGEGDGHMPMSTLALDAKGNLYGTTYSGGFFASGQCAVGCGTVFRIDATGKFTVLHRFKGGSDGGNPAAGLLRSADGKFLYGTTASYNDTTYAGTVFQVGTGGETVLYGFPASGVDGTVPLAGLVQDAAGNLYGTTSAGSFGSVFKLTP